MEILQTFGSSMLRILISHFIQNWIFSILSEVWIALCVVPEFWIKHYNNVSAKKDNGSYFHIPTGISTRRGYLLKNKKLAPRRVETAPKNHRIENYDQNS